MKDMRQIKMLNKNDLNRNSQQTIQSHNNEMPQKEVVSLPAIDTPQKFQHKIKVTEKEYKNNSISTPSKDVTKSPEKFDLYAPLAPVSLLNSKNDSIIV